MALLEKEVPFEHVKVDLQDKPADFVALYASLHPDPTARAKVMYLQVLLLLFALVYVGRCEQ